MARLRGCTKVLPRLSALVDSARWREAQGGTSATEFVAELKAAKALIMAVKRRRLAQRKYDDYDTNTRLKTLHQADIRECRAMNRLDGLTKED